MGGWLILEPTASTSQPGRWDRRTILLRRLCQLVLVLVLFLGVAAASKEVRPNALLTAYAAVAATMFASLALLRRGHSRAAGIVSVFAIWLIITASIYLLGGPRSPGYFAYFGAVLFAAFFWGRPAALVVAALSALAGFAFYWADAQQLLPPPLIPPTPRRLWIAMTALIFVTVGVLELALRTTREALEEANERVRQQATVAELGALALASHDLRGLLDDAVRFVARTIDVEFCKILELDPLGETLLLRAGVGWKEGCVGQVRVRTDRNSQAGYTLDRVTPVVVEDFASEERFDAPPLLREHAVASGISCTIAGSDEPWGVLSAHSREPRRFGPDDVHFLEAVANVLSAAVERQLLEERVRRGEKLEAVGQLAGGVAHDFNNLLTVVSCNAEEIAEKSDAEGEIADAAREILSTANRAGELTRRLLVFARQQHSERRPVRLDQLVQSLEPVLRTVCGEDVEVRVDFGQPLEAVLADPLEVEQVLVNLAVNARDAMPEGGVLSVEGRAHPSEERRVLLRIEDTGFGMDRRTRERAFEPFFTTKEPGRGTGLGLASAYQIVKQMGGEIRVQSRPGRGTRFEIDLPCTDRVPEVASSEPKLATDARLGSTILVVEDDETVRSTARRALVRKGYEVLEASDGEEALAVVERHGGAIHALVSDVVMPRMGGLELCERLSRIRPGMPTILVSGHRDRAPGGRGTMPASARLLQKPFTSSALLAELQAALAG